MTSRFVVVVSLVSLVMTERVSASDETSSLSVKVTGLQNKEGKVALLLFASEAGFPEDVSKAARVVNAAIGESTVSMTLPALKPGNYAISVIHDQNSNRKLDRNFVGMPSEGYGFSNNVRPTLRAATFEEARFALPVQGKQIQIAIGY